ncbi:hypothetical protein CRENBAI_004971 [Crenichthys baileyi]|uniref:Uncharacterized protein n=1 Tax=Crenichthys baileyi TaxID=28760 RepID=A0AAV9RGC6_9TELE
MDVLLSPSPSKANPLNWSLEVTTTYFLYFFIIFLTKEFPLLTGHPWHKTDNPHINWTDSHIEAWCSGCHACCLHSTVPSSSPLAELQSAPDLSNIPSAPPCLCC